MLVSWGCNCDFKIIMNEHSVLSYILNYTTKGESKEKSMLKSIFNSIKAGDEKYLKYESSRSLLRAISGAMDRTRIVSVQESIHALFGKSLYWTDQRYVNIPASMTVGELESEGGGENKNSHLVVLWK